jgi:hypothetical protein
MTLATHTLAVAICTVNWRPLNWWRRQVDLRQASGQD